MENNLVDIIIPVFNELAVTRDCFNSILESSFKKFRIIIIDNASDTETENYLKEFSSRYKNVYLVRNPENLGWVKAINQGINLSRSPYLCVMNNDTIVRTKDWLECFIRIAEISDDIGLINPLFTSKILAGSGLPYTEIDFCRGYCVFMKRVMIDKVGLFDEAYGLGYYDDDDFSVRAIRAGFRCVRANFVVVEHLRDTTFSSRFKREIRSEMHDRNKELFYSKWGKRLNVLYIGGVSSESGDVLKNLLLFFARRQHIVYFWNFTSISLNIAHINIREKMLQKFFRFFMVKFLLFLNSRKKPSKRYALVFTDDKALFKRLPGLGIPVYYVNLTEDISKIHDIIDKAAFS